MAIKTMKVENTMNTILMGGYQEKSELCTVSIILDEQQQNPARPRKP